MQRLEPSNGLNEVVPELLLGEIRVVLLVSVDLLKHVSCVGVLHHNAKASG